MQIRTFDAGKAALHFANAEPAPWANWLRYALLHAAFVVVLAAAIGAYVLAFLDWTPGQGPSLTAILSLTPPALIASAAGALFWAVMETAALRYYLTGRFALGLGDQEVRTFLVGLHWLGFVFAWMVLMAACIALISLFGLGGVYLIGGLAGVLALIAALVFWAAFAVRHAPASALTFVRGRVCFTSASEATRDRRGSLFGGFLLIILIVMAISVTLQIAFQIVMAGVLMFNFGWFQAMAPQAPEAALVALFTNPALLITLLVFYALNAMLSALQTWAFLGANALAVKTMGQPQFEAPVDTGPAPTS